MTAIAPDVDVTTIQQLDWTPLCEVKDCPHGHPPATHRWHGSPPCRCPLDKLHWTCPHLVTCAACRSVFVICLCWSFRLEPLP